MFTERDRALLTFLAEQRVATSNQLARVLHVTERTAWARTKRLESLGALTCQRVFPNERAPILITTAGLAALGRRLPEPQLVPQTVRHDVGVGWLSIAAAEGAFGELARIVSEREMRSHDGRPGNELDADKHGIALWPPESGRRQYGPGSNRHYPDLVLQTPEGHRIALELELTGKSTARLRSIMSSYVIDLRYARVLYFVRGEKLAARVASAADWAGAEQLVGVRAVIDPSGAGLRLNAHRNVLRAPSGRGHAMEVTR